MPNDQIGSGQAFGAFAQRASGQAPAIAPRILGAQNDDQTIGAQIWGLHTIVADRHLTARLRRHGDQRRSWDPSETIVAQFGLHHASLIADLARVVLGLKNARTPIATNPTPDPRGALTHGPQALNEI